MFSAIFGGGEEEEPPAATAGTEEAQQDFHIGDTVHSETIQKGKSGSVVGLSDGKVSVQFPDESSPVDVDPSDLKKGVATELVDSTTDDKATPTPISTEAPETTTDPLEAVATTVDDKATPTPIITEAPETTEAVAATVDETSKLAEEKPMTTEAPETTTEAAIATVDATSKLIEEKPLGEFLGEVDAPVVQAPETTTEPVQEKVAEVKPVETSDPSSTVPTAAMPMEPKLEPALVQLEPAITQLDPQVGSSVEANNSTPLKEEASSTAPATPEPSIAISGSSLSEVYQPSQQFTGPSPTNLFSGNRGGKQTSAQTSAYAALSTNECNPTHLAANTALSTETLVASMPRSKLFATPTMRSRCGGYRQRLRDDFNTQEIMMEMIFCKFDNDNSGLLDPSELKLLLQAHSTAYHINIDDAVKFILAVADENEDGGISKMELVPGLQAWHAFNNMPPEVNRALNLAGIRHEGSPLPSSEQLWQLLNDLNGFIDPDPEEVAKVRSAALAVGGTEERVTLEQMRMAISVWYTNVERKPTTSRAMMEFSLNGWAQSLAVHSRRLVQQLPSTGVTLGMVSVDDLEAPLQEGEAKKRNAPDPVVHILPFAENKCSDTTGAILWLILFILPGIFMVHVADDYPTHPECQHDLSALLEWKGYLTLAMGFGGLMYQIVYDGQFRTFCLVVGLTSLVVSLMQAIVGVGYVLVSTPDYCGEYLWNVNAFFFVWSLCWGPCLGCFCLCSCSAIFYSQEFQSVSSAESQAQRARRLVSPSRPVSLE